MNSLSKPLSSKTITDDDNPEESGWTMYFEDFWANNKEHNNSTISFSSSCYDYKSSSDLVSDAASSVGKKSIDNDKAECFPLAKKTCKKLSFKKRKTTGGLILDDALEDTASSPVNSPKVR